MTVTIRTGEPADAEAIRDILDPIVRDTVISFELTPPSAGALRERMNETLAFAPWLVAEDAGAVVGYANGSRFRARPAYRFSVETSVYVAASRRGRGVGRALYAALLACLRAQGFRSAIGGIALPNEASVALHESFGFRRVGVFPKAGFKLGRWVDVGFWELELLARDGAPPEPLTPAEAAATPAWRAAIAGR